MENIEELKNQIELKRNELLQLTVILTERVEKNRKAISLKRVTKNINSIIEEIQVLENKIKDIETNIIVDGDWKIIEYQDSLIIQNEKIELEAHLVYIKENKAYYRSTMTIDTQSFQVEERVKNIGYWIKYRGAISKSHKQYIVEMENVVINNAEKIGKTFFTIQ